MKAACFIVSPSPVQVVAAVGEGGDIIIIIGLLDVTFIITSPPLDDASGCDDDDDDGGRAMPTDGEAVLEVGREKDESFNIGITGCIGLSTLLPVLRGKLKVAEVL